MKYWNVFNVQRSFSAKQWEHSFNRGIGTAIHHSTNIIIINFIETHCRKSGYMHQAHHRHLTFKSIINLKPECWRWFLIYWIYIKYDCQSQLSMQPFLFPTGNKHFHYIDNTTNWNGTEHWLNGWAYQQIVFFKLISHAMS